MEKSERAKIERWDFVDNTIHEMLKQLNPLSHELKWDIKPISEIREVIIKYFVDELKICTEDEFYPYDEDDDEENIPVKHDWYVILYPYEGNKDNYKCVVEEMPEGKFNSDYFVKKYGNYAKYGPYEQENWAVKAAIKVEEEIEKLHGRKPYFAKRPEGL